MNGGTLIKTFMDPHLFISLYVRITATDCKIVERLY